MIDLVVSLEAPGKGRDSEEKIHPEGQVQDLGHVQAQMPREGQDKSGKGQHVEVAHEVAETGDDQRSSFMFHHGTLPITR